MSSDNDGLHARLRRLEDRAALHDLVVRYFVALDDLDWDTLSESFAWEAETMGAYGRDQVAEILREERSKMGPTVHTPDFMLFTFESDDRATGVIGSHWELSRDGSTLFGAARYHDTYVRENGAWRILEREVGVVHVGPWDQVSTSLTEELRVRWPGEEPAPASVPVAAG